MSIPFCFSPFPPQTFVFSLWKNLFLFTCAGLDLQGCLDYRSHMHPRRGSAAECIFYSFSCFSPDWMTWSQHLSACWEENVLRKHYLLKLPLPLLHRSLRSDSPELTEWAPSLCVLETSLIETMQLSLWMGVYFCCWCSESVICKMEPIVPLVVPRSRNGWIPHCLFHFTHFQSTPDAFSSGQVPRQCFTRLLELRHLLTRWK